MTTIKNFFALFLLVAVVAVFTTNSATAQRSDPKEEFVIEANEAEPLIGMLVPAVQKVREAAARQLASVLQRAQTLAQKVGRAGSSMSDRQYQGFQRELANLEAELDKIQGAGNNSSGNPAPGTVGACHKSCHDAFGNGFGGGKGWNRFVCKMGCIKIGPIGG